MRSLLVVIVAATAGCIGPLDPAWSLSHDHVIAVRAERPALLSGERAQLDALVAHADGPPTVEVPLEAGALELDDTILANVVYPDMGTWWIEAPSEYALMRAREQLALAADAPVPVDVYLAFGTEDAPLFAKKRVLLGATATNPAVPLAMMDGAPMTDQDALVVPRGTDVYLSTSVAPEWRVNWLSSCGTLFQDDVATSFLRVEEGDPTAGNLAVVVRAPDGGVAWRVWSIAAD